MKIGNWFPIYIRIFFFFWIIHVNVNSHYLYKYIFWGLFYYNSIVNIWKYWIRAIFRNTLRVEHLLTAMNNWWLSGTYLIWNAPPLCSPMLHLQMFSRCFDSTPLFVNELFFKTTLRYIYGKVIFIVTVRTLITYFLSLKTNYLKLVIFLKRWCAYFPVKLRVKRDHVTK